MQKASTMQRMILMLSCMACGWMGSLVSGCQVYNSSSGDVSKFTANAQGVFARRCTPCHDYGSLDSVSLLAKYPTLMVRGNPESSLIFSRIRGSAVGGSEDMPQAGSSGGDLTDDEILTVKSWIQSL